MGKHIFSGSVISKKYFETQSTVKDRIFKTIYFGFVIMENLYTIYFTIFITLMSR